MAKRDCYEVLGVSREVGIDEIKRAYRKLALQYHPDRNPGNAEAEAMFREATEAYSILSDAENRRKYDQFGHAAFEQRGGGAEGFGDFSGFEDIFGDIFSSFFGGGGGGRSRARGGRDLKYDLEIEFQEAVFGAEREITIGRRATCLGCSGTGAAAGSKVQTCRQCGGHGQIRVQQGFFTLTRPCNICGGSGQKIENPCKDCRGSGQRVAEARIKVKIPAGIDHGQRLKLRGEGEPGESGAPAGDLYVQVAVREHPIFQRQESELICEAPISYTTAVLGAEIDVPTLEGPAKVKVPPGTQSGKIFKIRHKGVPILGTTRRGDLHVRVNIEVPKKISDDERQLLERLQEIEAQAGDRDSKGWFERVKSMFA